MNEKIKELMLQAGYAAPEMAARANKLAELIVLECCQIVLDCSIPESNNERDFVVTVREIKQHFGVEE